MSKKGFIYSLIMGVGVASFLRSMERTESNKMQNIAQERVAESLDIDVSQLQELLDPQGQGIATIVHKKYSGDWTSLMHMARGRFLCKQYAEKLYEECENEEYQKILPDIYLKIAKLILNENDADINAKNEKGKSALMIAFKSKNEPIIKLLLESDNIAMNDQDEDGLVPLHYAIKLGYDATACQLIERGAPLNTKTKFIFHRKTARGYPWKEYRDHETPLMLAARRNSLSVVECLLDRGADPLLKNFVGQKAYDIATDDAVKKVIKEAELQKKAIETAGEKALQIRIEAKKYLEGQQKLRKEEALQAAEKSAKQQEERERKRQKLAEESARQQEKQERERKPQKLLATKEEELRLEMLSQMIEESAKQCLEREKQQQKLVEDAEKEKLRLKVSRKASQAEKESVKQQAERERKQQKLAEESAQRTQSFREKLQSARDKLFAAIKNTWNKFLSYFQ